MSRLMLIATLALGACVAAPAPGPVDRPQDEVPMQSRLPNGDRLYGFAGGCRIVIERVRAVVKSETGACALYHRDIALLYASGD